MQETEQITGSNNNMTDLVLGRSYGMLVVFIYRYRLQNSYLNMLKI